MGLCRRLPLLPGSCAAFVVSLFSNSPGCWDFLPFEELFSPKSRGPLIAREREILHETEVRYDPKK